MHISQCQHSVERKRYMLVDQRRLCTNHNTSSSWRLNQHSATKHVKSGTCLLVIPTALVNQHRRKTFETFVDYLLSPIVSVLLLLYMARTNSCPIQTGLSADCTSKLPLFSNPLTYVPDWRESNNLKEWCQRLNSKPTALLHVYT